MEESFANLFKTKKGWEIKLPNKEEVELMKGDIDLIVEDSSATLYIQMKRPYFRLDFKEIYYESTNSDKKAAEQLNLAEKFLSVDNQIFTSKHNPTKWIVSTSYENIGKSIKGCLKVNYFDCIKLVNSSKIKTVKHLKQAIEGDLIIKEFAKSSWNNVGNLATIHFM